MLRNDIIYEDADVANNKKYINNHGLILDIRKKNHTSKDDVQEFTSCDISISL